MTGTYDPELNLLYVGTGNPTPVLNGERAPRRQSVDVRDRRDQSGQRRSWCGDFRRRRTTRTTGTRRKCRCSSTRRSRGDAAQAAAAGVAQRLLLRARSHNGKSLLTKPFATVNWAKEIDKDGRPMPNPEKEPKRDGRLVAPNEGGATNYRSPSFDPRDGPARRQRGRRLRHLLLQAGARRVRLGGREFERVVARGAPRHRLSDRRREVEPRHRRRRRRSRRADDRDRRHVHGRHQQQPDRAPHQRRRHALACVDRARRQFADHDEMDGRQFLLTGGGSALYAFALPKA